MKSMQINAIGYVQHNLDDDEVHCQRSSMVSEIIIDNQWTRTLTGLEEYSHIFVMFWMHKLPDQAADQRVEQLIHPRGDKSLPLTGVLASRVRNRPNPIGMAVAELLKREGNRLTVKRLDAFSGTPVIDIKPYDDYDVCHNIRVPEWWKNRCRK